MFVYPKTEGQAHMFLGTPVPATLKLAKQGHSNHQPKPYWQSAVALLSLPDRGPTSIFPLAGLLIGGMVVLAFLLNHIFFLNEEIFFSSPHSNQNDLGGAGSLQCL